MKLSYSGQEQVQAPTQAVWDFVRNPQQVARCLPDVQDVQVTGENQLVATVQVGVGMVRGKFKFNIDVQPEPEQGRVNVVVKGGGLGSVIDMTAGANVVDNGDGTTTLDWQGDADMRGPVANIGGRMLDVQAKKLIERTFQNMGQQVASQSADGSRTA